MKEILICEVCHHQAWEDFPEKNYEPGKEDKPNHIMIKGEWYVCEYCKLMKLYNELIMAVGNKYKGGTRHETALKYIKRAEEVNGLSASQVVVEEPVKGKE